MQVQFTRGKYKGETGEIIQRVESEVEAYFVLLPDRDLTVVTVPKNYTPLVTVTRKSA